MTLRNIAGLYLVRLRGRLGQELLALVGIAAGVALLFAALVANTSLGGSFDRLTAGVVGDAQFQLAARGSATLDENLLAEVKQLPGVERAAATLETRGEARGPGGRQAVNVLGVTPELGELGGAYTRGFSYDFLADVRVIAMPTWIANELGIALGGPVTLAISGRMTTARLGAKLDAEDIGGVAAGALVIAPLGYAQELAGASRGLTRILVVPRRERADAVERELRDLAGAEANVLPALSDTRLFRQASAPTNQSTAMFSIFGAMVGFLLAFSAMLLTVPQRRRLIADLDNEGFGMRTIAKLLAFDACVLGAVGSALGVIFGIEVAHRLFDEPPSFLTLAFAVSPGQIVRPADVALAVAGGMVASGAAVFGPVAMSLRHRRDGVGQRQTRSGVFLQLAGGAAALAAGVAVIVSDPQAPPVAIAGLASLTLSLLLLLPTLVRRLVDGVDLVTGQMRSVVPFLAIFDLRDPAAQARTLAVAATGAVAIFGSVALQGAHADLLRGLDRTSQDIAGIGDVWASAAGEANLLVTTPFAAPEVARRPELRRVDRYRGSFLDVGDHRARMFGVPRHAASPISRVQLIDGDLDAVAPRLHAGGWVVLSKALADDLGAHVGGLVSLPTPRPLRLRVAALSTNLGWPSGAIVMDADDFATAWGSDDVSAVVATLAPGVSQAAGERALRAALGDTPALTVRSRTRFEAAQQEASRAGVERLAQIAALVLVSAVIAMAAAMGGLIWQRRRYLAGLKVEGYRSSQLWRALLLEAAILMGAGCAVGAAFGLCAQALLTRALGSVTGFPVVYAPAIPAALLTCLLVTATAVAIVALFGQQAARVAPTVGFGD